jgi:hypothetical protein
VHSWGFWNQQLGDNAKSLYTIFDLWAIEYSEIRGAKKLFALVKIDRRIQKKVREKGEGGLANPKRGEISKTPRSSTGESSLTSRQHGTTDLRHERHWNPDSG